MRLAVLLPLFVLATPLLAAGSDDDTPPEPTRTVTECAEGQIYDEGTQTCVDADKQSFNDDQRHGAVRELAYAGAFDRAEAVIASAQNPGDPRFLNYRGFLARKQGRTADAMTFYAEALAIDPDYHLARSYMGQGLVAEGDIAGAKVQLAEIVSRGGRDTWAYTSLKMALRGAPSAY